MKPTLEQRAADARARGDRTFMAHCWRHGPDAARFASNGRCIKCQHRRGGFSRLIGDAPVPDYRYKPPSERGK